MKKLQLIFKIIIYKRDSNRIKVRRLLKLDDQTIYKKYHIIKLTAFDID